jgi:hypothetical protein
MWGYTTVTPTNKERKIIMKIYINDEITIYVGKKEEIIPICKSIIKHSCMFNYHGYGVPKMNKNRLYGLQISYNNVICCDEWQVLSEHTILDMILTNEISEYHFKGFNIENTMLKLEI